MFSRRIFLPKDQNIANSILTRFKTVGFLLIGFILRQKSQKASTFDKAAVSMLHKARQCIPTDEGRLELQGYP